MNNEKEKELLKLQGFYREIVVFFGDDRAIHHFTELKKALDMETAQANMWNAKASQIALERDELLLLCGAESTVEGAKVWMAAEADLYEKNLVRLEGRKKSL